MAQRQSRHSSHLLSPFAADIGMTTVLVRAGPDHAARHEAPGTPEDLRYCNHITSDLATWLSEATTILIS